ncbi:EsaB/YukD family protein [Streptococcus sp. DD13]|uniref:EsaB/YukD family protein n=1 Tax=Streptococcus sp. DD13 TaxID=1777881 RepID=UPI0007995C44|nr:EsaB/YukD family protein [Streptococcus sp. DD13]KXT77714.1 putative secretion accessory protein EsaB/YukD [Streptococcus sp. DD13]
MHINITLMYRDTAIDLRIPLEIEVGHLIRELATIFHLKVNPYKGQLKVVGKGLLLDEGKRLADYPLSTGDRIELLGIAEWSK